MSSQPAVFRRAVNQTLVRTARGIFGLIWLLIPCFLRTVSSMGGEVTPVQMCRLKGYPAILAPPSLIAATAPKTNSLPGNEAMTITCGSISVGDEKRSPAVPAPAEIRWWHAKGQTRAKIMPVQR